MAHNSRYKVDVLFSVKDKKNETKAKPNLNNVLSNFYVCNLCILHKIPQKINNIAKQKPNEKQNNTCH